MLIKNIYLPNIQLYYCLIIFKLNDYYNKFQKIVKMFCHHFVTPVTQVALRTIESFCFIVSDLCNKIHIVNM